MLELGMELLPRNLQLPVPFPGPLCMVPQHSHGTRTSPHMAGGLWSSPTFAPGRSHAGHSLTPGLSVQLTLQVQMGSSDPVRAQL